LSDHAGAGGEPAYPTCACDKKDVCRLRKYAALYEADPTRHAGARREGKAVRPHGEVTYDPGKCILCGICVELARQAGEPLGLTVTGRGFDVQVDVPFDESLAEALRTAARRVAGACPTGALARRRVDEGAPG
jgi:NADH dehydrogenase/NADH:ubiquinone oxidoreductase subunit G